MELMGIVEVVEAMEVTEVMEVEVMEAMEVMEVMEVAMAEGEALLEVIFKHWKKEVVCIILFLNNLVMRMKLASPVHLPFIIGLEVVAVVFLMK